MKKLSFLLLLSPVFFFLACDDDDVEIRQDPIVFYDSNGYVFQATCIGDDIEFFLDVTPDRTDAAMGSYPNHDVYRISVDYNNNQVLDANVDLMFAPTSDGRMCQVFLLTQSSTTGCNFSGDITGETLFSGTENDDVPHINHRLRVPKNVLSSSSTVRVVVELYDSDTGWITLPEGSSVFSWGGSVISW